MTVRESGILASLSFSRGKALVQGHDSTSFLWKEVPRRGGGWLTKRNKKEWGRSIFPYHHPERSRRIFVAAASSPALLIRLHEAPYPTFMEYQASRFRSHAYTENGKDFSLALEMTCGRRSPLMVFHTAGDSSQPRLQDKIKRTNHLHDWFFSVNQQLVPPGDSGQPRLFS